MKQPKYKKKDFAAETQKSTRVDNKEKEISGPSVHKHPKLLLAGKVLVILAIVIGVVNYTDNKKYFEPYKGFRTQKVMPAFYSLIEKDTIDVCLFGSSHIGEGINAHVLSNCLGCTCFSMHQDGSDLQDVYYSLKDVLTQTKIKVAVFETFTMTNVLEQEQEKSKYSKFKMLSTPIKLEATARMFPIDEYWAAWSNTVRNHSFLFRDTARINQNIHPVEYPKQRFVYLGSEGRQVKSMSDSLIAVYDSLGPIVDGNKIVHDEFDFEYFDKIVKLCEEYDTKVVFLTIPEYYRNIKNYSSWKNVVNEMIGKTNYPWLDLQDKYDTTMFRKELFENNRLINQHIVATGAPLFSSILAAYLKDSLQLDLPDRTKQKRWHDMFYGSEGYYLNYSPRANDTICHTICDSLKIGPVLIQNAFWSKEQNVRGIYVKFDKSSFTKEQARKPIEMLMDGEYQGRTVRASFKIMPTDMFPVNNYLYKISVINDFTPKAIIGIKMSSSEAKAAIKN